MAIPFLTPIKKYMLDRCVGTLVTCTTASPPSLVDKSDVSLAHAEGDTLDGFMAALPQWNISSSLI